MTETEDPTELSSVSRWLVWIGGRLDCMLTPEKQAWKRLLCL